MVNHFALFAHGESFDVDAFLTSTALHVDYIWRRGDERRYSCAEDQHVTNGIEIVLGDGLTIPQFEQDRIAIEYLKSRREGLHALAAFPGVETFILGLQYHLRLDGNVRGFCMEPSSLLMWHALDIGARLNYYVTLDRRHDENHSGL